MSTIRAFYYLNTNKIVVVAPKDSLTGAAVTTFSTAVVTLYDKATGAAIVGAQNLPLSFVGANLVASVPSSAVVTLGQLLEARIVVTLASGDVLQKTLELSVRTNDS